MSELKIKIIAFTDGDFPGWVKCIFQDIHGRQHSFLEKVPIVTAEYIDANSEYPKDGMLECSVLSEKGNVITIDTGNPSGVETEDGSTVFEVFADQLK